MGRATFGANRSVPLTVLELAIAQLVAYNARDIVAFCACYADDVRVLDEHGVCTLDGLAAFRDVYGRMFAEHAVVGGVIEGRVVLEPHCVEDERWWRTHGTTGVESGGRVLVRYTAREGRIQTVQFMRGADA